MTQSYPLQRRALFEGLVKRAREGKRCLSMGAMELAYDFNDQAQLSDALSYLAETGHIAFDIDGRFPAIRIFKPKMNALHPLAKPLFLSPGQERENAAPAGDAALPPCVLKMPVSDIPLHPPRPSLTVPKKPAPAPLVPKDDVREVFARIVTEPETAPVPDPVARHEKPPSPSQGRERGKQVSFHLTEDEADWILDALDKHPESISFSAFCKQIFQAEVDRRRADGSEKHHISAMVMRAAREEGVALGLFVTRMIEVGMAARDMNRRGV